MDVAYTSAALRLSCLANAPLLSSNLTLGVRVPTLSLLLGQHTPLCHAGHRHALDRQALRVLVWQRRRKGIHKPMLDNLGLPNTSWKHGGQDQIVLTRLTCL